MLPIIDYGQIAIVIPKITAVGEVIKKGEKYGFEVYVSGMEKPVVVGLYSDEEAREARNELIAIIAQYYYSIEFGPDFEFDDFFDKSDEFDDEEPDDNDKNNKGH